MPTSGEKFRALHEGDQPFLVPNPWDIGSARILTGLGFSALATTSGGMAYALGKPDGAVRREEAIAHCRDIVAATHLPVSADLEKGYGDRPEDVADVIRTAAETGLAGCSIEDFTGNPEAPLFDKDLAVDRITAASEASAGLSDDFVLTARCEGLVWESLKLDQVIDRLQAFEAAGADVLFAPGLDDMASIRAVVSALSKPVNVIMSTPSLPFGVKELAEIGVKRISIGSAFAQLAYGKLIEAAKEMATQGTFTFTRDVVDYQELEALFTDRGSV